MYMQCVLIAKYMYPNSIDSFIGTSTVHTVWLSCTFVPTAAANVQLKRFCKKVLVSFLSNLPTSDEELLSTRVNSPPQEYPSSTHPLTPPTPVSVVLYVLCDNPLDASNTADKKFNSKLTKLKNSKTMQESFQVLLTFSELLSSEDVPEFIQRKLVLQVWYIYYMYVR